MQQYSSLPEKNSQVDVTPNNLLATPQQLRDQLWLESSLNQLLVCLNECLTSACIEKKQTSNLESQIYQVLVSQLHNALSTSRIVITPRDSVLAIALPQTDTKLCQVCYVSHSSSNHSQLPFPEVVLETGKKLHLKPKEIIEVEDLQYLEAQESPNAWSISDSNGAILGWLILSLTGLNSDYEAVDTSAFSLISTLISRAANQFSIALVQLRHLKLLQQTAQGLESFNQELERTNKLKNQFLANTSHEIRTPLSSVIGFTHLLLAQGYDSSKERHQEYLHIIQSSGKHLLALINDILDLSKIEANQLEIQWEKIDVAQLCRNVLALIKEKAANKGLTLSLEIDEQVDYIVADPLRLKQMLLNLLFNALKFTNEGSVSLDVKLQAESIYFTISDTGTGISPENQAELFQPYCQIPNTVVNREEGTGLGLALTRKLAEIHGGRIEVESKIAQGSKFIIVLPLNLLFNNSEEIDKKFGVEEVTQAKNSKTLKNETLFSAASGSNSNEILLVEDDLPNAQLIQTYLRREGYQVTCIHNAAQTWNALTSSLPSLILMDVYLPDANGLKLVEELRSRPEYRNIPIIAQTAMAMKGDREICLKVGVNEYISKPIDLPLLSQLVAKYIQVPIQLPTSED
ncbi:MAG: hybrid histidine kinase/response regulator HrmK [Cyanobacteria bacterium P01_A01_bin.84]